jgi:hypothetical protein
MTDLTKTRPSYNPWIIGLPFWSPRQPGGPPRREPSRRSLLVAMRCRLRRNAIDRELAAGADPESSECRRLRAAQLTAASSRQALAAAYERHIVGAASFPQLTVVPVNWRAVRAATPRLDRLVERLREDPRVRAQGVARARLLLTDNDGALYAGDDDRCLVHDVRSTLALL